MVILLLSIFSSFSGCINLPLTPANVLFCSVSIWIYADIFIWSIVQREKWMALHSWRACGIRDNQDDDDNN